VDEPFTFLQERLSAVCRYKVRRVLYIAASRDHRVPEEGNRPSKRSGRQKEAPPLWDTPSHLLRHATGGGNAQRWERSEASQSSAGHHLVQPGPTVQPAASLSRNSGGV